MDLRMPSSLQWVFMTFMMPYAILMAIKEFESRKPDHNCISKHSKFMKGVMHSKNCTTISMKKAKELSKTLGVSFNELVLGITSKTLKWHFDKHGDKNTEIAIGLPMTFKKIPKNHADYVYGNDFSSMTYYLKLESDLKTACLEAKRRMDRIKRSWLPVGFYGLMWFYGACFPIKYFNYIASLAGRKYTMMLSNVPAFTQDISYFGGNNVKRFFTTGTGPGNCATCIHMISVTKRA